MIQATLKNYLSSPLLVLILVLTKVSGQGLCTLDTIAPTVYTQSISINLDQDGLYTLLPSEVDNGSTDNCALDFATVTPNQFNCDDIGANTVILTWTDESGNFSSATTTVTVADAMPPELVLLPTGDTITLNSYGQRLVTVPGIIGQVSDNCTDGNNIVINISSTNSCNNVTKSGTSITLDCSDESRVCGTPSNPYDLRGFTISATDNEGNVTTVTRDYFVIDQFAPEVYPENITLYLPEDPAENAQLVVNADLNTGSEAGTALDPVGLDSATNDACGLVSVELLRSPIQWNADLTHTYTCEDLGTNTYYLRATDIYDNRAAYLGTVTIVDTIKPDVNTTIADIYIDNNGIATLDPMDLVLSASDNIGDCGLIYSASQIDFSCVDLSWNATIVNPSQADVRNPANWTPTQVTSLVTDAAGNVRAKTASVRVMDTLPPVLIKDTIEVDLGPNNFVNLQSVQDTILAHVASYNCTLDLTRGGLARTYFDCDDVGPDGNSVALNMFDIYGNSQQVQLTVIVHDLIAPVASSQNITVQLDASGSVTVLDSQVDDGSTDNCAFLTYSLDQSTFGCEDVGQNNVILTVTDREGNTDTATATVFVEDNMPPTTIPLSGQYVLYSNQLLNGYLALTAVVLNPTSYDNCKITDTVLTDVDSNLYYAPGQLMNEFTCDDVSYTDDDGVFIDKSRDIVIHNIDESGNWSSGTAKVILIDVDAPVITVQNAIVSLGADGTVDLLSDNYITAEDECGVDSIWLSQTEFDCSDVGSVTVTITASDASGNTSVATKAITIVDTLPPVTTIDTITSYGPYTWIDGNTYIASNNTASHTLTNAAGCDSIVTLHLTIPGSWTQAGSSIDGEAAGDRSGYSVSLSSDGSTVAIGAKNNNGNGTWAGHVRIYKNISGTWTQVGADIDGEAANDQSGRSVSLSSDGSTVAIGALFNDGNGTNAGHVRIYKNISGTWTQQGADIDGEAANDFSGISVSLSSDGSTVAIGAQYNDGNGSNAGHVRIYKNTSGNWTQVGADIDGEAANDWSGYSVSLSSDGSTVAIGAEGNDGNGSDAGHVRIYKNISGTWTQVGADIDGEALDDYSGRSVSLSSDGSTVAIGATHNDGNGSYSGHVRIYKNISGTWTQQGADIDGEAANDFSGISVSLSSDGSTVAIGADGNDGNGSSSGHVRIYKNVSGSWTQQGSDIDGEAALDYSGRSVSLSSDGSTVAIGATGNDGNGSGSGHVRVFNICLPTFSSDTITSCGPYTWIDGVTYTTSNYTATDTLVSTSGCDSIVSLHLTIPNALLGNWTQQGADIDGISSYNYSGRSVSLSGDGSILAIGEPGPQGNVHTNQVRVFNYINYSWTQIGDTILGEALTDNSGWSVSLSEDGKTLAIGAYGNDGPGANFPNIGQVRVFKLINSAWTQLGNDIYGEGINDNSGWSVSLSADGSIVAVGAYANDGNGSGSGHVRVYKLINSVWTQLGNDIDGEGINDNSGCSVSLSADGSTVAIGAKNNDGNGSNSGHVRVFSYSGSTWTQLGSDIDGEAAYDASGTAVSISSNGTVVAIGANSNDGNGTDAGHVRVFQYSSGTWTQVGADIDGEAANDFSGWSVSLSSDASTVAIGAYGNDGNGTDAGHVRIYKNISGTWTQVDTDIDGEAAGDNSGWSVSLSSDGSTVAIGAPDNDDNGTKAGHVRVYNIESSVVHTTDTITSCGPYTWIDGVTYTTSNYTATDTLVSTSGCDSIVSLHLTIPNALLGNWTQQGADIDGISSYNYSGRSVSLSGDGSILAIGEPGPQGNVHTNQVRVFNYINYSWTQIGDTILGEALTDNSGWSVSLSEDGKTLAIGAYGNDGPGANFPNIGQVRVFKLINSAWTQLGNDIYGEGINDNSGWSVSLSADGSIVAVGAYANDGNGSGSGHVRVYKLINSVWTQLGNDIDGEGINDNSGCSVSLSADGSTVAIGAKNNDGNGSNSGHVRVFSYSGSTWTQLGSDIDGEAAYDASGTAVSISSNGTVVAIGANSNDGNGTDAGHVRVFQYSSGTWTQVGADIDGEAANDFSGWSVSLSSDASTVAIGAYGNDGNGTDAGHVRIYKNISGTWTQVDTDIDGEAAGDNSGWSVSLSSDGSTVAIGAPDNDDNGTKAGHVRVYNIESSVVHTTDTITSCGPYTWIDGVTYTTSNYTATDTLVSTSGCDSIVSLHLTIPNALLGNWTQQGADIDGISSYNYSGRSVSLSGDGSILAIGEPGPQGNVHTNQVRVFNYINYSWTQIGDTILGEALTDNSGWSVSLSEDGKTLAIGAYGNDGPGANFPNIGQVRVFKLINSAWTQLGNDIYGEGINDNSGWSVSLSADGSIVAVGAYANDGNGSGSGHVRVYKLINSVWTQLGNDIDGEGINDNSGCSVSLSADGSTVAIGAKNNDGNGSNSGHVRVFSYSGSTWTQLGSDIDGEAAYDASGTAVSISSNGTVVAIGANSNDGNGTDAGHVRVFQYSSGTWTQVGADIDGEAANDFSGWSVSLSSDASTVAIGAYGNDGNGTDAGHVRIYKNISGTWTQVDTDIDGEAAGDNSGWSVSLSSDGSTVAIGAPDNDDNGTKAGHVRVYNIESSVVHTTDTITSCGPYTWIDGVTYTTSNNTATDTILSAAGCDSAIVILHLTINSSNTGIDTITACDSYTWIDGLTYTASNNTATYTLTNAAGCDSVVTLDLTINSSNTGTDVITACDSYTWIDGNTYSASNNTATYTLTNAAGCDSVVTLDLTINSSNTGTDVITACDSYTWIDGNTYTTSNNTATYTLTNAAGCDSVVTLDLTINSSNTGTDVITACDSYTWIDGNTYTASNNTATYTLTNAAGCDSIVTLNLTINSSNTGTDVITACDSYTWIDGNTYTASNNIATYTLTNAAGCDSLVTLDLTINSSNTGTDVITACDSYTWIDGNTYTASNNSATYTLTNAAGCDSVVTLDLTINSSNTGTDVITACDSYTWIDGNTYNASNNIATYTLTNAAGCDSVVTLDLTINSSNTGTDVITACDSYTWIDGLTYTTSNNSATYTLTNASGCDSVVTLNLTVNSSNTGTDVITACDSYTWIDGNTYTASNNTATYTLTNASGCDSVVTLDLTVNSSNTGTDVITACDSYTWIDGNTYTASNNTATYTLTNAAGCDSVVTLDLTINSSNTGTDVITACDSYTWIDGNTYTASNNTATYTLTNASGCDSVVTLDLTINSSNTGTDVITACDSYTWIDGNTYTASNNTATYTLTNAAGCDSVVTLDLTINSSNTGTDVITACDSYTWIDGNTYTANNNTATHTLTNASGCDSVVTLDLTINSSNTGTDVITACDSYTWIDGNTYTASNNSATYVLNNVIGCDSVVSLDLTITYSNNVQVSLNGCDQVSLNGQTYTASGIYIQNLVNSDGCDSILTINANITYGNFIQTQPTNQSVGEGLNAVFFIVGPPTAQYQWQTNLGIGYSDLNDFGQYSGTTTSSLQVSNVNLAINNNQAFRCLVTEGNCTDTTVTAVLEVVPSSSVNELEQGISIYPNPTQGRVEVVLSEASGFIRIYDLQGRLLDKILVNQKEMQVSLGMYANGVYVIQIEQNGLSSHHKITLNR
jgi:hypothetical protein